LLRGGGAFLITPTFIDTAIDTLDAKIQYGKNYLDSLHKYRSAIHLKNLNTISEDETKFSNRLTLCTGYEFSIYPSYQKKIDSISASIPIKGFYIGSFFRLYPCHPSKYEDKCHLKIYCGVSAGIFSIKDATITVFNPDALPLTFSSETTIAPETYIVFGLKNFFLDISYQYLNFSNLSYAPVVDGTSITAEKYSLLPRVMNLSSLHITFGISFAGKGFLN
jgi:hypothetical protein